jgi:hypothetical protein
LSLLADISLFRERHSKGKRVGSQHLGQIGLSILPTAGFKWIALIDRRFREGIFKALPTRYGGGPSTGGENMLRTLIRRGVPLLAAFVLGASLVGVATAHRGSPEFLHARHSDSINGRLRADHFRFSRPFGSYVVIAPAAIEPLDPSSSDCSGFNRKRAFALAPPGCEMVAQVAPPNHSTITNVTWDFQFDAATATDVYLELVSYNDFGTSPSEPLAGVPTSDPETVSPPCDQGCKLSFDAFLMNGVNPVIPQRRTYSLFFGSETEPIRTTRILVTTMVRRPGPF